ITPPLDRKISPRIERIQGYKKALHDHGINVRKKYIGNVEIDEVEQEIYRMTHLNDPPTAIYLINDLILMEALNYIKKNNINMPEELEIISVDDVPFADIYNPALTTIRQPWFKMGKDAAHLLLKKTHDSNKLQVKREVYRYKPELIARR